MKKIVLSLMISFMAISLVGSAVAAPTSEKTTSSVVTTEETVVNENGENVVGNKEMPAKK